MHLLSPCSRIVYHENNVRWCTGLRSVLDLGAAQTLYCRVLVSDLRIRGCVTCRIIKIVKDPSNICLRAFRRALYINMCGYAHTCCKVSIHQAQSVYMRYIG